VGSYRLVEKMSYKNALVYIRFVDTHKGYDAIDVEVV
jgi:mRNA-degrading endonuclease HigB of HigAB toxin-antitoxin module